MTIFLKNTRLRSYFFMTELKNYNVTIYLNRKDTCLQCDKFDCELKNASDKKARDAIDAAKKLHKKQAD